MAPAHAKKKDPRRAGLRVTGGLKALADAKKNDASLILADTQKFVLAREGRDLSRRQDIIHPSEMAHGDWCPKATYQRIRLLRDGGTHTKEAFGFQSLNIFAHGHEVHHKWQTWLADQGLLWGQWLCLRAACKWQWFETSPVYCPNCGNRHFEYREVPLSAEKELLIVGSADGAVPKHRALMEFKTVGSGTLRFEDPELLKAHTHKTVDGKTLIDYEGLWRGINRPFTGHLKQGQIYLWICELLGLDYDSVIYIYESKFHQGTKEFVVQRRQSVIQPLLDAAQEIKDALAGTGPIPACPQGGCKHCEPKKDTEGEDRGTQAAPRQRRRPDTAQTRRTPDAGRAGASRAAARGRPRTARRPHRADD